MSADDHEKVVDAVAEGLTEAWIKRFPRIDERGLRDRLYVAAFSAFGKHGGFTPDDIADAEAIAAALREHVHVVRRMMELVAGDHPDAEAAIFAELARAEKAN